MASPMPGPWHQPLAPGPQTVREDAKIPARMQERRILGQAVLTGQALHRADDGVGRPHCQELVDGRA